MKYQSLDRFTGKITGNPHEFNGKKKKKNMVSG